MAEFTQEQILEIKKIIGDQYKMKGLNWKIVQSIPSLLEPNTLYFHQVSINPKKYDIYHTDKDKEIAKLDVYNQRIIDEKISEIQSELDTKVDEIQSELDTKVDEIQSELDNKVDEIQSELDTKVDELQYAFGEFSEYVDTAMTTAYLGIASTTTTPPATGAYWYRVDTAGTYTNFKNSGNVAIVVSAGDLDGNDVLLDVKDNVVTKRVVVNQGRDFEFNSISNRAIANSAVTPIYEAMPKSEYESLTINFDIKNLNKGWINNLGQVNGIGSSTDRYSDFIPVKRGDVISGKLFSAPVGNVLSFYSNPDENTFIIGVKGTGSSTVATSVDYTVLFDGFMRVFSGIGPSINPNATLTRVAGESIIKVEDFTSQKVNTIADLRNLQGRYIGQLITLMGYYAPGDKASVNYRWNNVQGVDDGGSKINATGGSWEIVLGENISVLDFGVRDNIISTEQYRKAVKFGILSHKTLDLAGITVLLDSYVYHYRPIDSQLYADVFLIKNGTIKTTNDVPFLWGDNTQNKASQFINFQNVKFRTTDTNGSILKENSIIRMKFISCDFIGIKFTNTIRHLQSIYFSNCNIRGWNGCFLKAIDGAYDIRFSHNIIEYGQTFLELKGGVEHKITNVVVDGNCIEGLSGAGIKFNGSKSISITNNYFEKNLEGSIVCEINRNAEIVDLGVNIKNNYFHIFSNQENDNTQGQGYWHIVLNKVVGSSCEGNNSDGNLCFIASTVADIVIRNSMERGAESNKLSTVGITKHYYGNAKTNENLNWDQNIIKGSILINNDYVKGEPIYWTCVQSGTSSTSQWLEVYPLVAAEAVPNGSTVDALLVSLRNAGILKI